MKSIVLVLIFKSLNLFATCYPRTADLTNSANRNHRDRRTVQCLANESFSCWNTTSALPEFPLGTNVCSISSGLKDSWYNEVPLIRESDLQLLHRNGFKFTEYTYKSWKNFLKLKDAKGSDSENLKFIRLAGEDFSCWNNISDSTKFPIDTRICAIVPGKGPWYNEIPLIRESDLITLDNNDFKFTQGTHKSWKFHLTNKRSDGSEK